MGMSRTSRFMTTIITVVVFTWKTSLVDSTLVVNNSLHSIWRERYSRRHGDQPQHENNLIKFPHQIISSARTWPEVP